MDKKVNDLTETLSKMALWMEKVNLNNTNGPTCYHCREKGHIAPNCKAQFKICKGTNGQHAFRNCPDCNSRYRQGQQSYLIMQPNTNEHFNKVSNVTNYPTEVLSVEKRPLVDSSENELRVSRSGKKVKVHDTVPRRYQKRSIAKTRKPTFNSGMVAKPKTAKTKLDVDEIQGTRITAEEILKLEVFKCSLEQLLPLKGLRTDVINKTKQKRSSVRKEVKKQKSNQESLFVTSHTKIRKITKGDGNFSNGTARVEALVEGSIIVNAVLDPGSQTTFISKRLAEELKLVISPIKKDAPSNRMANGTNVKAIGQVDGILIQVQCCITDIHRLTCHQA